MTDELREYKLDLLKQLQEILAQFDNREANIPITNKYWGLLNEFRMKEK